MDVETEILDLKLRVEDLEVGRGAPDADPNPELGRQAELLREINDRTRHLQKEIAALRGRIGVVGAEVGQDIAALQTEVEGVRRAIGPPARPCPGGSAGVSADVSADLNDLRTDVAEGLDGVRAEMAQEFASVRSEMLDLGIKLDRLLHRHGD
ncbi:hypothetical protein MF672_034640 [Actinomadura sp. ATCC 31491]|uniref:Uncharacterized protein n=1 Tax=Actinomadura luzonensis TaxID=2805427 RepID=A0ABT0G435_9ACTN|nr:hypothetical protein [Actinomadura luzonensis]MCK2218896.1 hypothetical protein [Actinomadura luzonensis]